MAIEWTDYDKRSWSDLTKGEQREARKITSELLKLGYEVSVSQVAKYWEAVRQWKDGAATIGDLIALTRWPKSS